MRPVILRRPNRDEPHYRYADTLTIGDEPTLERYQQLGDDAPIDRSDRPFRLPSGVPNLAGVPSGARRLLDLGDIAKLAENER